MVKSVALNGGSTTHCLGDIVTEPVDVGLKGLTLRLAREVEPSALLETLS